MQHRRRGYLDAAELVEREAVKALTGVGGDHEWWMFSPRLVGHLRVPITAAESLLVPFGIAVADAGESGARRPRTSLL